MEGGRERKRERVGEEMEGEDSENGAGCVRGGGDKPSKYLRPQRMLPSVRFSHKLVVRSHF